ncbi:MAG: ATP-binding cassette domain-containing protein [Propionibacteriaceae bacterium]|jgi:ATPase subunit of ABC transporter with duplicated ATPase domains|nr:ATP-binding cassette domain-containing protein [Propionibacteriaceae bacterium]
MSISAAITLNNLGFAWPNGEVALDAISGSFSTARTGLVGDNGSGKSTLLRLMAGELQPTSGTIAVSGQVGYLPQLLRLDGRKTVADLLGVGEKIAALNAIEAGSADAGYFDIVGDDWDIEARAAESLAEVGLGHIGLDRSQAELSGGESMLLAVLGLRLQGASISLLDEPTNNLDRDYRARVGSLLATWPGTLVVVSHDEGILNQLDEIAELYAGQLSVFGGSFSQWQLYLARQQEAAEQSVRVAQQRLKAERKEKAAAETRIARRVKAGKKAAANNLGGKGLIDKRINASEKAIGKLRSDGSERIDSAKSELAQAESRLRDDEAIRLDLPDPDVPHSRRIAELVATNRTVIVQGPERIAIVGSNGVGKSTLLNNLRKGIVGGNGKVAAVGGRLLTDRVGYLDQFLGDLDEEANAVANVLAIAPQVPPGEIRNRLARMLLRGDSVNRPVSSLSGGERFRVALARLLLADPPLQLLILDEPTNNLDMRSVAQLSEALSLYRGALIVVSHDDAFLEKLGPDQVLGLNAAGGLDSLR